MNSRAGPRRRAGDPRVAAVLVEAFDACKRVDPNTLTHGFHSYPAHMHPGIARTLMQARVGAFEHVLDPFCGSGTVCVEAMASGHSCIGVDLNPLAIRIAAVRTELRNERERTRFVGALERVAEASHARARARVRTMAAIPASEVSWYAPHVLRELAGLWDEIATVEQQQDRRGLEIVFSAMLIKFSRQRADTSEDRVDKHVPRGRASQFFLAKGRELIDRWKALEHAAPRTSPPLRLIEGDALQLPALLRAQAGNIDLVVTSPPYGGTYDYARHHARRFAWLGLDVKALRSHEIGSRRKLATDGAMQRWDHEVSAILKATAAVMAPEGLVVLLLGDARMNSILVRADEQVARLSSTCGLEIVATASEARVDWQGGAPRREHLIALKPNAR